MNYLNKINDTAYQRFFLTGNKGQNITLTLRYMPFQEIWVMDVEYQNIVINGVRVVNSPNILHTFKNTLPFGFMCASVEDIDPTFIDDFSTQRSNLYLLNEQDVLDITEGVFNAQ